MVGAAIYAPLMEALEAGGRMVVISAVGGREVTLDLFDLYRRELRLIGLNTAFIDVTRGARILDRLAALFESGALRAPKIAARYPLSRAAEAYGNLSAGKAVLIPDRLFQAR